MRVMTLGNYLVIVLCENDEVFPELKNRIMTKHQAVEVECVHTPINGNTIITVNGFYDALKKSTRDFIVVVMATEIDKGVLEEAITRFEDASVRPEMQMLRRRVGSSHYEWCKNFEFVNAVVVAAREDLWNILKQQSSGKDQ